MDIIQTLIIIVGCISGTLLGLIVYVNRTLPKILSDMGEDVTEAFGAIFEKPMTKRAMSILGKESGRVRLDASAENALAENILNNMTPEIRMVLDRVAPDFIETYGADTALALATKYAPLIQQFLGGALNPQQKKEITEKFGRF